MQLIIIMFKNTFDSIEPNLHVHSYIHAHMYIHVQVHVYVCVIVVFVLFFLPVSSSNKNFAAQLLSSAAQRTGCVQLLRHPQQARHPVRKSVCVCVCLSGFSALLLPGSSSAYTHNKGQHDDRLVSIVEFVPDHGLLCIWIDMAHAHTHTYTDRAGRANSPGQLGIDTHNSGRRWEAWHAANYIYVCI